MSDQEHHSGFAILIKAPGVIRRFTPTEGETIAVLDKAGKEIWSVKIPSPIDNPGIIAGSVHLDILTEREFTQFCQKTWGPGRPEQSPIPGQPS